MANLLPPHDGLLPKWLLLVAIASVGNSIQAYTTLSYTRRLYAGPAQDKAPEAITSPVTPLSARTFGTWTLLTGIVRVYAAYHIEEPAWYQVALWTFLVGFGHFMSEMALYKSARWRGPWLSSASVATISLIWMTMQYSYYVNP